MSFIELIIFMKLIKNLELTMQHFHAKEDYSEKEDDLFSSFTINKC